MPWEDAEPTTGDRVMTFQARPPEPAAAPQTADAALARAGAVLTVDLDALVANWRTLKAQAGGRADCAAVLKADGYGLGAAVVGPTLAAAGCRVFFVAHVAEGLALAPHLPADTTLYILHGCPPGSEAEAAAAGLVPVLNSLEQVAAWSALAARLDRRLPAALQVDSGMSRGGMSPAEVQALADDPDRLAGIDTWLVMSHLACADEPESPMNGQQLAAFRTLRAQLPVTAPASFANSSGVFLGGSYHFDLLRPGAALYGVNPTPGHANPMRPVVRLQGKVMQLREVPAGAAVGYGCTHVTCRPTRVATVSVGYADGFLRSLSGRACAWLGEARLPLLGRVSMDMITLDATDLPADRIAAGTLVDLIDHRRTVDAVAAEAGTIGYEILTSLGPRYLRRYVGGTR
ncbi:alanine racemase [Caenispirillum bisanense]